MTTKPDMTLTGPPIIMPGDPGTQPPPEIRAQAGCSVMPSEARMGSGKPSIVWPFLLVALAFALRRRLR
jgi:MYXO-CTERM domain-containing protein